MTEINDKAKVQLLFKEFTGVVNAKQPEPFSLESFAFKDYILNNNVLLEDIPATLPSGWRSNQLDASANISDNSITNLASIGYPQLSFHKRKDLTPVTFGSLKTWYVGDGSGGSALQNAIPFKQDPGPNNSYNYSVYQKYPGSIYSPVNMYSNPTFWLFDFKSGFLEFYGDEDDLNGTNLGTGGIDLGTGPPAISFFQYVGATGGAGGSGGNWTLAGNDIHNNNSGDVGIGGNAKIANSPTLSTITNDHTIYARNTTLIDTLKISSTTFFDGIWQQMLLKDSGNIPPNLGDPGALPTFVSIYGPNVIPIAYIPINQDYTPTAPPTINRPFIANSIGYFTIKLSQPPPSVNASSTIIHWDQSQKSGGPNFKSGLGGIPEQTIHFIAGYIDNYLDPGAEIRKPKPFIKILSTNIINLKCTTGITQQGGMAANIAVLTDGGSGPLTQYSQIHQDTPKIGGLVRIIIAESLPGSPADVSIQNKAWLLVEQTWNDEPWQNGVNTQILKDIISDHIIDVKLYQNSTGELSTARDPSANVENTDWQLVTESQISSTYAWDKFVLPMGPNATPQVFPVTTAGPGQSVPYTLQVGGTPAVPLGSYPVIDPHANLWEVELNKMDWPYGITTTEEIFKNNVDIYGNLTASSFQVNTGNFTDIMVTNQGKFGPNQSILIGPFTSTLTGIINSGSLDNGGNEIKCGILKVGNGGTNGSNMSTTVIPRTNVPIDIFSGHAQYADAYYKLATCNITSQGTVLDYITCNGFFEFNYYVNNFNTSDSATLQTVRFIVGCSASTATSTSSSCYNLFINILSNQSQGSLISDIRLKNLIITVNNTNEVILYGKIHRETINVDYKPRYTLRLYQGCDDLSKPHNDASSWKFVYGNNAFSPGNGSLPTDKSRYNVDLTKSAPIIANVFDGMDMSYNGMENANAYNTVPTFFEEYVRFSKGIDISNTKIINARGLLGKNQYVIGNNHGASPNANDMYIESLGEATDMHFKVQTESSIKFTGRKPTTAHTDLSSIDINMNLTDIDMDFQNINNIKNVKLLTATDISANYISVVDLSANLISVNNLDIHTQIDMNNNYIVNSKFSSIDLQNANSSSGGVLSSFLNHSGTQKENVKIESGQREGILILKDALISTKGMKLDGYGNIKKTYTNVSDREIKIQGNGTDKVSILRIDNESDISGHANLLLGEQHIDTKYCQQIDVIYDYSNILVGGTGDNRAPFFGIKGTGGTGGVGSVHEQAYLICSPVTDGNGLSGVTFPDGKFTFALTGSAVESSVIQIGDYYKPNVRIGGGQGTAYGSLSAMRIQTNHITSDRSGNGGSTLYLEGSGNEIWLGPDAIYIGSQGSDVQLSNGAHMTYSNGQTTFIKDLFLNSTGVDIHANGSNNICSANHTGQIGTFGFINGTELKGEDLKVGGNITCGNIICPIKFFNLYNEAQQAGTGEYAPFIKYCNVEAPQGLVVLRGQVKLAGANADIDLDSAAIVAGTAGTMIIPHSFPNNHIVPGTFFTMFQNFTVSVVNAGIFVGPTATDGACVRLDHDTNFTPVQAHISVGPSGGTFDPTLTIKIRSSGATHDIYVNYRVEMERKDNFYSGKDAVTVLGSIDAAITQANTGLSFKPYVNPHTGSEGTYSAAADTSGNYY